MANQNRALQGFKNIAVIYKNQKKAKITCDIFSDWYNYYFILEVNKCQEDSSKCVIDILIVDNAPIHVSADCLETESGQFKVLFLPPYVTSILQLMDQGIIISLKCLYYDQLMRKILLADNEHVSGKIETIKVINLKDCCCMMADT